MSAARRPIRIRPVTKLVDFRRCEELQREAWGFQDLDIVPTPLFTIAAHYGGLILGAYDGPRMIGFVYSLPALLDGQWIQYSHMLAVIPEYQRRHIGLRLKMAQASAARAAGFREIAWTFDPMQSRNANLNTRRLGATASVYYPNLYGQTSSPLHRGLPTDRLLARWKIAGPRRSGGRRRWRGHPPFVYDCSSRDFLGLPAFRFLIPGSIDTLKRADTALAFDWQRRLREVFQAAFADGFEAADFELDLVRGLGSYVLVRRTGLRKGRRR